ncbi:MAG: hypothetical protein LVR00_02225 [Rhabdochlamydiaceae bacterium]|jgi:hypothetical protein
MVSLAQCVNQVNSIQNQASNPLSQEEHSELVQKLDRVKITIDCLSGVFTKSLKDQVICLYGKIDDALISHELNTIKQEALNIQNMIRKGDCKTLSQTTRSLKNHIAALWDHYCPSLKERRVIAFAEEQLEEAASINGKCSDHRPTQNTKAAKLSAQEKEETEYALEAIGEALSENDEKRAAFAFNALSKEQQKLLCTYLPKEERSSFLHEIERAANNNKIFLRKR